MNALTQSITDASTAPEANPAHNAPQQATDTSSIAEMVLKLKAGYTRLPNLILMEMIHGDLSKAEIEIALLIARFTISFKDLDTNKERQLVPLSKHSFAKYTGLQGKTVLEALQKLQDRGLIRKVQGNHEFNNQFGLVYPEGLFDKNQPSQTPPTQPPQQSQQPSNASQAPEDPKPTVASSPVAPVSQAPVIHPQSPTGEVQNAPLPQGTKSTPEVGTKSTPGQDQKSTCPPGGKSTHPQDQKSTHFKQYELNQDLNNSVNQPTNQQFVNYTTTMSEQAQGQVHDYFDGIQGEVKKAKEWEKFQTLRKLYPFCEIATGLSYLLNFGIPNTGVPCHSPMGFLCVGMHSVKRAVSVMGGQSGNPVRWGQQSGKTGSNFEEDHFDEPEDPRERKLGYGELVALAKNKAQQQEWEPGDEPEQESEAKTEFKSPHQSGEDASRSAQITPNNAASAEAWPDVDFAIKRNAFDHAYPTADERNAFIREFVNQHPFFRLYKNPERFAISDWYANRGERRCAAA